MVDAGRIDGDLPPLEIIERRGRPRLLAARASSVARGAEIDALVAIAAAVDFSEGIDDLLAFMEAASPAAAEAAAYCREQLKSPREELDPPPLVTGDDLIAIGIPQGPQYRILLEEIRREQLDGNLQNREDALRRLRKRCRVATPTL